MGDNTTSETTISDTTNSVSDDGTSGQAECPDHISPWTVVFIVLIAYLVLFVIILFFFLCKRLMFGKPKKKRIKRVWNHHKYQHYLHPYCHRNIHNGEHCHHHPVDGPTTNGSTDQSSLQSDPHQGPYPKAPPVNVQNPAPSSPKTERAANGTRPKVANHGQAKDGKEEKKREEDAGLGLTESEQSLSENDQYARRKQEKQRPVTESKDTIATRDAPTRTHPLFSVNYKRNDDKDDAHKGPYPKIDPIN